MINCTIILKNSQKKYFCFKIEIGFEPRISQKEKSSIKTIRVVLDSDAYTAVEIYHVNGKRKIFITSNKNNSEKVNHKLNIDDKNYEWSGSYYFD